MRRITILLLILFPIYLKAQVIDANLKNLNIEEIMSLETGINTKEIEVSKDEATQGNTINIGLLLPYSLYKIFSKEIEDAVQLAADEINSAGGIMSKKIRIIPADDGGNTIESIKKAYQLVEDYQVQALIGPTGSTRLLHVAKKVTIPRGICLVSSGSSSSLISEIDDNGLVWRVTPIDYQETTFASDFIINNLNKNNVGIIYVASEYGKSIYSHFVDEIKKRDGKLTGVLEYNSIEEFEKPEFKGLLEIFFNKKPEIIYLVATPYQGPSVVQFFEDYHFISDNYSPLIFSSSSNKAKDFLLNSSEKIMDLMYGISQKVSLKPNFIDNFEDKYVYTPSTSEASGAYDIVYLLAYAMIKAKNDNSTHFAKYLREFAEQGDYVGINEFSKAVDLLEKNKKINYSGASGNIIFNEKGDLANPEFEIWKLTDNRYVVID